MEKRVRAGDIWKRFMYAFGLGSLIALGAPGCGSSSATTQPVTDVDARLAEPAYWLNQPATSTATGADFDALWSAAEDAARARFFPIDRRDRRLGVMTTEPVVSAQWFEPWRRDAIEPDALADSSLATIRRTIRFEFERRDDGAFVVAPRVLVERYAQAEVRVTSVVLYRSVFRLGRTTDLTPYGTKETDRGIFLPNRYWYAVGRDHALEQALADEIQRRAGSVQLAPTRPDSDPPDA